MTRSWSVVECINPHALFSGQKWNNAASLIVIVTQALDMVDCILYARAVAGGDHLFTFDADLNKMNEKLRIKN